MGGVEHALDGIDPVPLLALGDIVSGKAQIIKYPVGVGPLSEQIIVLEKMVVPEGGMGQDQGLHRHGIFFHDIADTRVGVDHDLIGKPLQPFAVERFVKGEAFAETPVMIHEG